MNKNENFKSKRRPLLHEAKITDNKRRKIREKEREINKQIKEKNDELVKIKSDVFQIKTDELSTLYDQIHYPRELNLDAFNLDEFNQIAVKQGQTLSLDDYTKFDVDSLIQHTLTRCSNGSELDWHKLGVAVGAMFNSVPEIDFLYGSMDTKVVAKTNKTRQKKSNKNMVNEEEIQVKEYHDYRKGRQDAQARRLKIMENTLTKESKVNKDIDLFKLAIHPKNFTETVENMFDLSFLIKTGEVQMNFNDEGLPIINVHDIIENNSDSLNPTDKQCIITMTPDECEEISKIWQIEEPLVGTRRSEIIENQ